MPGSVEVPTFNDLNVEEVSTNHSIEYWLAMLAC